MVSIVTCHICGEDWSEDDERVIFTAGLWECYDQVECIGRVLDIGQQVGGWTSGGCA